MKNHKTNRIPHFDGLYEELNVSQSADYIFSELIATRSQTFGWVVRPHIHTKLYQLFSIESGTLIFQGNLQEYLISKPCLILIPPGAVHGFKYQTDVIGRILTFSETFLEQIFEDSSILSNTRCQVINHFEEELSFENIKDLVQKIDKELFGDFTEKRLMLKSYIAQLFISLRRMIMSGNEESSIQNPAIQYFRKFQQLMKLAEYPRSISHFAEELKISSVHLNRICQQIANKSALQLVQIHLIEESKKYLTYTSHSVSEIAYLLKFEYPNYFAKLFKSHTGQTPKEFREEVRK